LGIATTFLLDAISRGKIIHQERFTFNSEQIAKLLSVADVKMRAMIWLGLNCGFGCADCAELKWADLDPKSGKLVFYASRDKPLSRTRCHINEDGSSKYSSSNLITSRFSKLMKKAGIQAPKGTGFYTLRRTAATVAARSGDPFAVQRLLGHANLKMATIYVQDVSEQTDRVIENSRKYVIQVEQIIT
jgi:integrase